MSWDEDKIMEMVGDLMAFAGSTLVDGIGFYVVDEDRSMMRRAMWVSDGVALPYKERKQGVSWDDVSVTPEQVGRKR